MSDIMTFRPVARLLLLGHRADFTACRRPPFIMLAACAPTLKQNWRFDIARFEPASGNGLYAAFVRARHAESARPARCR
jgi:hypothetical protein